MSFRIVNRLTVRPDRYTEFRRLVEQLALRARTHRDPVRWHAYRTLYGRVKEVHVSSRTETFADLAGRGDPELLWQRVTGVEAGAQQFARVAACIEDIDQSIALERPDLSYPPEAPIAADAELASVSTYRVRFDQAELFETLVARIVEAMHHVEGSTPIYTYQTVYGETNVYYNVRPLSEISDMDQTLPAWELLACVYGLEKSREIWQRGHTAVLSGRRTILRFAPELSHP